MKIKSVHNEIFIFDSSKREKSLEHACTLKGHRLAENILTLFWKFTDMQLLELLLNIE